MFASRVSWDCDIEQKELHLLWLDQMEPDISFGVLPFSYVLALLSRPGSFPCSTSSRGVPVPFSHGAKVAVVSFTFFKMLGGWGSHCDSFGLDAVGYHHKDAFDVLLLRTPFRILPVVIGGGKRQVHTRSLCICGSLYVKAYLVR